MTPRMGTPAHLDHLALELVLDEELGVAGPLHGIDLDEPWAVMGEPDQCPLTGRTRHERWSILKQLHHQRDASVLEKDRQARGATSEGQSCDDVESGALIAPCQRRRQRIRPQPRTP